MLSVETHLSLPDEKSSASPLEAPGYSRFKLTIIDKTGPKPVFPFANIPERDVCAISKATDTAYEKKVMHEASQQAANAAAGGSAAYTARFHLGNNKGRTPADILIEDPGKREALLKDREYLKERVGKFTQNQVIIDGIDDAVALLDAGKLAKAGASGYMPPVITIYDKKYKFLTSESAKDSEGRCRIYSISMRCDLSRKYPFVVEVENAMGFVNPTKTGGSAVDMQSLINREKAAMHLTDGEFVGLAAALEGNYKAFQHAVFMSQYEKAKGLARKSWAVAKSS